VCIVQVGFYLIEACYQIDNPIELHDDMSQLCSYLDFLGRAVFFSCVLGLLGEVSCQM